MLHADVAMMIGSLLSLRKTPVYPPQSHSNVCRVTVLGLSGLFLTALAAEVCRYGYIPTEDEVLSGKIDPLSVPNIGCDGVYAERLWSCQVSRPEGLRTRGCAHAGSRCQ